MADVASELASNVARSATPVGTFEQLGGLLEALKAAMAPQKKKGLAGIAAGNGALPRIVPNEAGQLIDLNTGAVVGSVR
jgi:hypothetical protein